MGNSFHSSGDVILRVDAGAIRFFVEHGEPHGPSAWSSIRIGARRRTLERDTAAPSVRRKP